MAIFDDIMNKLTGSTFTDAPCVEPLTLRMATKGASTETASMLPAI